MVARAQLMNQLVPFHSGEAPVLIAAAGERARLRFLEFFTANIRNPHTRRAYARGVGEFLAWCESAGVASIAGVQPVQRRDLHRMARPPRARPALGADGQAAARRDPPSVRLACRRPGGAVNPAASV